MKRTWRWLLLVSAILVLPVSAQAAACTGFCWETSSGLSCGYTAFQEGGICSLVRDYWGTPVYCVLYSCPGGPGWIPENQGRRDMEQRLPWETEVRAAEMKVTVRIVEPRS